MTKTAKVFGAALMTMATALLGGSARAATVVSDDEMPEAARLREAPAPEASPPEQPRPWSVRAGLALIESHGGGLLGRDERGVTVGRFVTSRLALEGTAAVAKSESALGSWSAMAGARWEPLRTRNARHALTLAGGPMVMVGNSVHGTTTVAHGEVAYIYRAPIGLTASLAIGQNVTLSDSDFVDSPGCWLWCPEPLHRGDLMNDLRLGVGWTF